MKKWLYLLPLVLTAACSRNTSPTGPAAAVGYASGSAASPQAAPPSSDPTTPVAPPADTAPTQAESVVPAGLDLPRGTVIQARLDETVDTRSNRAGDVVHATLARPIVLDGRTVVPAGTRFAGHVTLADSSGRMKGRAHIGVALDSFQMQGRTYRISTTSVDRASDKHLKRNGVLIGGGAGVGAAIGALVGGGKGALIGAGAGAGAGAAGAAATGKLQVAIPAETLLRFTLRSPVS
jgi:hypothetical protein